MKHIVILLAFLIGLPASANPRPKVWIYTDMSDKTLKGREKEGSVNDPDDISAMAGYILMCNEFETLGIVVANTHRKEHRKSPDQAEWANDLFGKAYASDLPGLQQNLGGYPDFLTFTPSCIKESSERFDPKKEYRSLDQYPTVRSLLEAAQGTKETINVLCWGSLTEPAILARHCLTTGNTNALKQLRFIAHWTKSSFRQGTKEHPEHLANCHEDAKACAFLKKLALEETITFHECGAIGQHGIVSGSPKGRDYFNQFKVSKIGTIFVDGKFAYNGVDHSDSATYWSLLGTYGVSLEDIAPNGTNPPAVEKANEQTFKNSSKRIHNELLRRSRLAAKP